ncbi:Lon protease family protein [Rosenbergiella sp. S61]|uniref:endopeptidase La n=1 Tax=Rosenbergiella gaditana TaxID=2726987 RepID=A0ABS5SW97_9GAMM|nr:Lon protease family protein [Rosenbergiella gaditana]MBT0724388.1 Lon protease family protein [Rosenbergiella gaditana]
MTSSTLSWQELIPDAKRLAPLFSQGLSSSASGLESLQPRLLNAIDQLNHNPVQPLLLIKIEEHPTNVKALAQIVEQRLPSKRVDQWVYHSPVANQFQLQKVVAQHNESTVYYADWIESDQLFGYLSEQQGIWTPELGLLHKANGGTLILSLHCLLSQPLMWLRLKKFISGHSFSWYSPDPRRPIPVQIPDFPLSINLILVGGRESLAEFSDSEPEFHANAVYTEIEETAEVITDHQVVVWAAWVASQAQALALPAPDVGFLLRLTREASRYTNEQHRLPINPTWLHKQLGAAYAAGQELTESSLSQALAQQKWRESYLPETLQRDLAAPHSLLETEGERIGQINGLSVLDLPGHPLPWGEPARISCLVHYGDGEINDVERKAELSGNIHAKGMMIIEAWLIAELELEQQLPFSASMVFEQSYAEVDGDSASLAELAVLISALSLRPLQQSIAVTGSVDQFGNVQPVGGLNEKIEGFYHLCLQQGLTGKQGVILPERNCCHLSLSDEVIEAVKQQQFHLWPVSSVDQALQLLMSLPWVAENDDESLLGIIQQRIDEAQQPVKARGGFFSPSRWLNWLKRD